MKTNETDQRRKTADPCQLCRQLRCRCAPHHKGVMAQVQVKTGFHCADPAPYINERRELEIAVAKARGWSVEPYIATIPIPCTS